MSFQTEAQHFKAINKSFSAHKLISIFTQKYSQATISNKYATQSDIKQHYLAFLKIFLDNSKIV